MESEIDRLRAAHAKVAQLVIIDSAYAPIFERLEHELALAESEGDVVARARAVVAHHSAMALTTS